MKVTIQDSKTSVTVQPRDFKVTVSGARGLQGDAGIGIAAGGAEGQILAKASATDYDTEWIDNYAVNVEVYVKNSSGSPMTKGQVVYISGADGTNPTISLAIATSEMGSSKTIGWLKQDLAQGTFGYVITEGLLEGINTNSAGAAGDPIWLSPTTAGGVVYGIANKPSAPNHMVFLGYVLRKQTNNGKVYVKVQNGFELGELHDVYNGTKTTPVSADALLLRDSADNNLWKRLTWTNALAGVKSHMDTFKSVANGYASLDGSGKVPSSELPSYVDDVVEAASFAALPVTGETGKIYVTLDTNKCYRWSGSVYIQVAQGVDTLTTTGTSGAATLVGSTLNIPQYQGVLTNPVTGTGTAGQVAYFSGTSAVTGSANLFWDNTNGRLGVGTNTPTQKLEITAGNIIIDNNSEYRSKSTGGTSLPVLKVDTSNNLLAGSVFLGSQFISYTSTAFSWYQYPGSVLTERMQLNAAGNLLIQNGGTFTDNGQRLQVYGSTLLRGSGTTSATTALLVQNSTPTDLLTVRDDGLVTVGTNLTVNNNLSVVGNATISGTTNSSGGIAATSGTFNIFRSGSSFAPTSGSATFTSFISNPTINQTGGANGITRGLYLNPTLTAAADWRSVEFSNNAGWGLYGAGTAANYLAGNTSIGTTTSSGRLTVQGSGTTSATKAFVVNNSTPTALLEILDNGRINQTIPGASFNTIFGTFAGANVSLTGSSNSFFGYFTGYNCTTGNNNSFFGFNSGFSTTTGGSNTFFGVNSGYNNTTGTSNSFFGNNSGFNATTGVLNSFFGVNAGRWLADGTTSLTVANQSVFFGHDTRANANSETNQIVIGYQAIGNGSNTATLGNTSITNTYLRGNINYTDGGNFVFGTTTGTKIGTSTTQKLSFWNATPIVQPTTAVAAATRVGGAGNTVTDTDTFDGYTIAQLVKALRNMGALA